jgi:hypothetical protein
VPSEFNPAARGFWRKHFTPFTLGMTRRVDERLFPAVGRDPAA